MKKTFTILSFITGVVLNTMAQMPGSPIGGIVVKGGKNPGGNALISLSGGITNPNSTTKQNANINNGYAFNANVYVPLFARGGNDNPAGKTGHFFSVGANARGEYFGSNKDYETNGFSPYNISGQSSSPTIAARGSGSPKVQGFTAELGIQANFSFGQVTISPILNAAYLNIKQQPFAITQSSSVNGQNRDFNLYTQAETKTGGFAFIPKLRLAYFPGKLGFFVDGNYTIGPNIKNETTKFNPSGAADAKGFYNIDQMLNGQNTASTKNTKYNAFGVNIGLTLAIGNKNNTGKRPITGSQKQTAGQDAGSTPGANAINNPLYNGNGTGSTNPMHESDLNYEEDYHVQDVKTLNFLNTTDVIIKKGNYPADYSQNPFGTITLVLAKPISAKSISEKGVKRMSSGGFHCDKDCKEEKDVCWTCKGSKPNALYYYFNLEPIVENGMITKLMVINNRITLDGKNLTGADLASRRRVEVLKSNKTDVPLAKEAAPQKVKCACGKDIYGKDEAACRRICQFLKDGTYINGKAVFTPEELQEIKTDYLNGFFVMINGNKELNPQLFKEVTKASDKDGQKVSITNSQSRKSYAFLGNQDELVKILTIPSARAQECTDCREADNCDNSTHYDCCCNNGYCWCLLCIIKSTMSESPDGRIVDANGNTDTGSQPTATNAIRPNGTGPKHWWRHRNAVNHCSGSGIYCITRKFMDDAEIKAFIPSDDDEILTESTISLKNNVIVIKSVGIKGQLTANTLKAFKDKKVKLEGNYLSLEILDPLFRAIKLNAPKEGIFIKANEQSYQVYETQNDGKKVSIVEAIEKTKININGKDYSLVIISTSGKGSGSPKQAGF